MEVSRAQGVFDWTSVRGGNLAFAYVAATEGGDIIDLTFARNWKGAASAGLRRGAVHRFQLCRSPEEQAEWFKATVPLDQRMLPPAIEIGWHLKTPLCDGTPSAEAVAADFNLFLYEIERHYNRRPVIRTNTSFRDQVLAGRIEGYRYWSIDTGSAEHGYWTLKSGQGAVTLKGGHQPAPRLIASNGFLAGAFARLAGL